MKSKLFNIIVSLVAKSWRIEVDKYNFQDNSIIAFWHSRMLPVWFYFRKRRPYAVVSKSKDGSILSSLLESWGLQLIRGSSSKGGKEVLDSIIENLNHNMVLITPDGPRGPKEAFKPGIFIASHRTQKPFYFIDVKIKSKFIFKKAWDKFEFPMPFSKIYFKVSGPIIVSENLNKEELNEYIQNFKIEG